MKKICNYRFITKKAVLTSANAFDARLREANVQTADQLLPYVYMTMISHGYSSTINSLLTDKPHSMEAPTWTLEMVTKYFIMKHETKPRDHGKKQEGHGRQSDRQPDKQPEKQLDQQPEKQQDRQPTRPKCTNCGRYHYSKYHILTNTSNGSNTSSKPNTPSASAA